MRACCSVEQLCAGVQEYVVDCPGHGEVPEIPGLLTLQRYDDELRLTVLGENPETSRILAPMGDVHIGSMSFEDTAIALLSDHGETSFTFPEALQ